MLLPELPGYLASMDAHHLIGWIVALFTMGAFGSRFVAGRVADRAGRKPVMLFGTAVTALAGFAYIGVARMDSVAMVVAGFLVVRFLHGLSTGFRPTGTSAFLTDLSPPARRGEAFGYLGWLEMQAWRWARPWGVGWPLSLGTTPCFLASSALGLAAYLMTLSLPETLPEPRRVAWQDLNVLEGGTVEKAAWPAAVFLPPVAIAFGDVFDGDAGFGGRLGFLYKGSFNTVVVAASIVARLVAGKASDRHGRVELLKVGAVLLAVGMTLFSYATTVSVLLVAGVVYGLSIGINMPAIFAWTIDLAPEGKAATALSTMLMALEVGIGLGAYVSGSWFASEPSILLDLYGMCAGFGVLGFAFLHGGSASTNPAFRPVDNSIEMGGIHRPSHLSFNAWRRFLKNN